jgi:hypothetical protein
MKPFCLLSTRLGPAMLCCVLAGCQTHKRTTHLSNGYEEVAYKVRKPMTSDEVPAPRLGFQYMGPDGKLTKIWPSLYASGGEIIHGGIAIFVGDKTFADSGTPVLHPRLFAVKAPELPLDITDQVLLRWSKSAGKDDKHAVQSFNLVTPEAANGGLVLHLEFLTQDYLMADKDWPDKADLQLSWDEVSDIMRTVNLNGFMKSDWGWKAPYINDTP